MVVVPCGFTGSFQAEAIECPRRIRQQNTLRAGHVQLTATHSVLLDGFVSVSLASCDLGGLEAAIR